MTFCSWYSKIPCGESWLDVEGATVEFARLEGDPPPTLTHGICPECFRRVTEAGPG